MKYLIPKTLDEALRMLNEENGDAVVIAGGSDIILDHKSGKKPARCFVDIMRIPEICGIRVENGKMIIGSTTLLSTLENSELLKKHFPSLAKGCRSVGSLQIRNSATLGGNVISAQPAADGAMSLAVLEPEFVIAGLYGERILDMEEMYTGFGRSALDYRREILKEIRIPLIHENEAAAFYRLELRKSLSLPMLNCAAYAYLDDGKIKNMRITMGPVGVGARRARIAEDWAKNREWTEKNIKKIAKLTVEDAKPRSNPLRGSSEYRLDTLPVIVYRALSEIGESLGVSCEKEV